MNGAVLQASGGGLSRHNRIQALAMFELCGQTHCTVAAVARQCGLSRGHFSMAFKAWTGYSPAQWRLARKIDMAKLLLKGPLSIADIAIECGFADQAHLTRSFRAAEGLSPGQWRSQFRAH